MKYTKEERIEIGRQVYTRELLRKDASTISVTQLLIFTSIITSRLLVFLVMNLPKIQEPKQPKQRQFQNTTMRILKHIWRCQKKS